MFSFIQCCNKFFTHIHTGLKGRYPVERELLNLKYAHLVCFPAHKGASLSKPSEASTKVWPHQNFGCSISTILAKHRTSRTNICAVKALLTRSRHWDTYAYQRSPKESAGAGAEGRPQVSLTTNFDVLIGPTIFAKHVQQLKVGE